MGRPAGRRAQAGPRDIEPRPKGISEGMADATPLHPGRERPRERLSLHGAGALSAAELIGVLWGSGIPGRSSVDAAADALRRHEGLVGLARATDVELEAVPGVGPVRAAQLSAAFELGRRVVADWPQGRWTVRAPQDLGERLVPQMGYLEREELRVVLLNTRNAVLRQVTVFHGDDTYSWRSTISRVKCLAIPWRSLRGLQSAAPDQSSPGLVVSDRAPKRANRFPHARARRGV